MPSILTKSQQELFDEWYRFYPRKKAVGAAEKAWKQIDPNEQLMRTMITAIGHQKLDRHRRIGNAMFVPDWPYPATWLNGRRWEDEPETVPDFIGDRRAVTQSEIEEAERNEKLGTESDIPF